ncbi:MAG: hypothetical protein QXG00_06725 [Candidatus Woesearchaeota archaeon]
MPATPNKGVYNFLINMSVNFKSTSKTSAVIGNSLRKLKQDFDSFSTSAKTSGNSIKANIEQLSKPLTEASKRASYFDTVWGKMFGVMMKFYSVMFFIKLFSQIGTSVYNASTGVDVFNQKVLAMYGYSIQGEKALLKLQSASRKYGITIQQASVITEKFRGFDETLINSLMKLSGAKGFGNEVISNIAKAFDNMRDTGKASVSDINELAKNGIYVWEEIQNQLGLTDEQLKNIGRSGIDVNKIIKAVSDAVKKTASSQDVQISKTQTALGNLKNTFEDFKKLFFGALIGETIFSRIINWLDTIILKINAILSQTEAVKNSQYSKNMFYGMDSKDAEKYYKSSYEYINKYLEKFILEINSKLAFFSKNFVNTLSSVYKVKLIGGLSDFNEDIKKKIIELSKETGNNTKLLSEKLFDYIYEMIKSTNGEEIANSLFTAINSFVGTVITEFTKKDKNLLNLIYEKQKALSDLQNQYDLYRGKKANAPKVMTGEPASSSTINNTIKLFSIIDDLLKELQYNIDKGIKNDLDGIYNFFESKITPDVKSLLKNLGEFDAAIETDVVNAFDSIKNTLIDEMNVYSVLLDEQGDVIKKYEYIMSVQYKLAEIEQLKQEYILKNLEMQLKTAVDIAKKQAEINKNNKFYQTLLSMSDFFDEVQQKIKVVSATTGQTLEEIVDTGLPKIKDSILNTMRYFYNTFSNIFEGFFSGDNISAFQSWGNALSVVATGVFDSISGFLDNLVKNFGNLMLGSLFSALSQVQGIQALLDPLSYILQVIASYILPTLNDLLTPIIGAITTLAILLAQAILPLLNGLMPFIQILAQYLANILTLLQPLIIAWSLIGNVLLQALLYPLTAILQVLSPIITALIPVFKFFAKILYWVGFIINGVIQAIAGTINVFIAVINAVLRALGKKTIPLLKTAQYMSYSDFNESLNANTGVSVSDLVSNAYNPENSVLTSSSGSGGANYTTSAQRPITVNVNVENWFGDETATRKLALIIKNEFEIIGVL